MSYWYNVKTAMTLTETARLTKRTLVFLTIALVLSISGFIGYQYYWYKIYLPNIPPVEVKPEVKFGKLPRPGLPVSTPSANLNFALDTETGTLPANLPKIIKVYFIPQLGATFLASDRAKLLAASFNFTQGPEILNPTLYKFTDSSGGQFLMDLESGNFKFTRQEASPSANFQDSLPDQNTIAADFKKFLSSKNLLKPPLVNAKIKVTYDKLNQLESTHAFLTLWQDKVDDYPIVTADFNKGLINASYSKYGKEEEKFFELNYNFWQVDQANSSTYPIISVEDAFSALKKGNGFIAVSSPKNPVSINSVYLAYLLTEGYTPYLQPVYVFEGQEFVAMLPAITEEFLAK